MAINNTSLAASFIEYDVDGENQDGHLNYSISPLTSSETPTLNMEDEKKFNTFRIQAGSDNGSKMFNIDMNLEDLKAVADAADKDIEMKFRTLKVCNNGSEANIVVLCSQAFRVDS